MRPRRAVQEGRGSRPGAKEGKGHRGAQRAPGARRLGAAASARRRQRRELQEIMVPGCRRSSRPRACPASARDVLTSSRHRVMTSGSSIGGGEFLTVRGQLLGRGELRPLLGPHFFELLGDLDVDQRNPSTASGSTWPLRRAMRPNLGRLRSRTAAQNSSPRLRHQVIATAWAGRGGACVPFQSRHRYPTGR